jgi:hypothetical protein
MWLLRLKGISPCNEGKALKLRVSILPLSGAATERVSFPILVVQNKLITLWSRGIYGLFYVSFEEYSP